MGASYMATGHYAKVKYNRDSDEFSLHASSDLTDDQSYYLSRLSKIHLERTILPLGDMRKREVKKIGKTLNYDYYEVKTKTYCFDNNEIISKYVDENSPNDLKGKGDVISIENKE